MTETTKTKTRKIHDFITSLLMSALVWSLINILIIKISFIQYITIEIAIGIGELVIELVKKKVNVESLEENN